MARSPKPLIIFKAGEASPPLKLAHGDFEDWISAAIAGSGIEVDVIDARLNGRLPQPETISGAIITGSSAMVTDLEPWSLTLMSWITSAMTKEIPILGICYGHQLLAQALGGEVKDRTNGVEIGTIDVHRTPDSANDILFEGIPEEFAAQAIHWQSVSRLPEKATLLAWSKSDPYQSFRVGRCAWGVQFHPEFTAAVMAGDLKILSSTLLEEGLDAASLSRQVRSTPEANKLLFAFARCAAVHSRLPD